MIPIKCEVCGETRSQGSRQCSSINKDHKIGKCLQINCESTEFHCSEYWCDTHSGVQYSELESKEDYEACKKYWEEHPNEVQTWNKPKEEIVQKQNANKPQYSLIKWEFLEAIAEVMTFGLTKYPRENYLNLDADTIYDSMMRHLREHKRGIKIDPESDKPHLWHFASNVMMWFMLEIKK